MVIDPQDDTDDEHDRQILNGDWRTIVVNIPLVSIDIMIEYGGVFLGKRKSELMKHEQFLPGGTIFNNEPRRDAVIGLNKHSDKFNPATRSRLK